MPRTDHAAARERIWKSIAVVAMLLAGGLVATMLLRSQKRPDFQQDATVRALTERIAAMERARAQTDQPALQTGPAADGRDVPIVATRAAGGDAAGLDAQQLSRQEQQAAKALESGFARQPVDADAPHVEIEMLRAMNDDLLAGTGITPRDPDVACKRDACRITAQFRSDADATDWAVYYLSTVGADHVGNSQQALVRNPDGSVLLKLYANRAQ